MSDTEQITPDTLDTLNQSETIHATTAILDPKVVIQSQDHSLADTADSTDIGSNQPSAPEAETNFESTPARQENETVQEHLTKLTSSSPSNENESNLDTAARVNIDTLDMNENDLQLLLPDLGNISIISQNEKHIVTPSPSTPENPTNTDQTSVVNSQSSLAQIETLENIPDNQLSELPVLSSISSISDLKAQEDLVLPALPEPIISTVDGFDPVHPISADDTLTVLDTIPQGDDFENQYLSAFELSNAKPSSKSQFDITNPQSKDLPIISASVISDIPSSINELLGSLSSQNLEIPLENIHIPDDNPLKNTSFSENPKADLNSDDFDNINNILGDITDSIPNSESPGSRFSIITNTPLAKIPNLQNSITDAEINQIGAINVTADDMENTINTMAEFADLPDAPIISDQKKTLKLESPKKTLVLESAPSEPVQSKTLRLESPPKSPVFEERKKKAHHTHSNHISTKRQHHIVENSSKYDSLGESGVLSDLDDEGEESSFVPDYSQIAWSRKNHSKNNHNNSGEFDERADEPRDDRYDRKGRRSKSSNLGSNSNSKKNKPHSKHAKTKHSKSSHRDHRDRESGHSHKKSRHKSKSKQYLSSPKTPKHSNSSSKRYSDPKFESKSEFKRREKHSYSSSKRYSQSAHKTNPNYDSSRSRSSKSHSFQHYTLHNLRTDLKLLESQANQPYLGHAIPLSFAYSLKRIKNLIESSSFLQEPPSLFSDSDSGYDSSSDSGSGTSHSFSDGFKSDSDSPTDPSESQRRHSRSRSRKNRHYS